MYKMETRRILLVVLLLSFASMACTLPGGGVEPEESPVEAATVPAATPEPVEQEAGSVPTAVPTAVPEVVEEQAPPPGDDPIAFTQDLMQALTPPYDYDLLSSYMGESFEIIYWHSDTIDTFASSDMVTILPNFFLIQGQAIAFEDPDYNNLIGGSPYMLYPYAVEFLYSTGWGSARMDEAILMIAQNPDGSYYWYGMLYADGSFSIPEGTGAWYSLPTALCTDLHQTVSDLVGTIDVVLHEAAPFTDYVGGTEGEGCQIVAEGTDADGIDFWAVYDQLGQALDSMGWIHDMMYDADGPTGSMRGYRRDSGLILLQVGWEPSEDANCPQDQPIGACELAPEQRLWTLELQGAMQ